MCFKYNALRLCLVIMKYMYAATAFETYETKRKLWRKDIGISVVDLLDLLMNLFTFFFFSRHTS